jgi:uncharacterized protein GlcG (DUF336 family)
VHAFSDRKYIAREINRQEFETCEGTGHGAAATRATHLLLKLPKVYTETFSCQVNEHACCRALSLAISRHDMGCTKGLTSRNKLLPMQSRCKSIDVSGKIAAHWHLDLRSPEVVRDPTVNSFRLALVGSVVTCFAAMTGCGGGVNAPEPAQETTQVAALNATDVAAVVQATANAVNVPMVISVVDRAGRVLAVYKKANAPATAVGNFKVTYPADEVAVALARTAAFFSNNQAPLSSRTVRYISGIHFPPGVMNVASADLYGIENTNRGCSFNVDVGVPRATLINGTSPGLGILTGKADMFDSDATAVNPGGIPLFKDGEAVGGVGVAADRADVQEYAAVTGAVTAKFLDPAALPPPGRVVIAGIVVPFALQLTQPTGTTTGSADGSYEISPTSSPGPVPEGDLIPETGGAVGGLSASEVGSIIQNALARANQTRAVIRLPQGQRTRMVFAVADTDGTLLAVYRMKDATVFSIDVAVAKARNMTYFNSPQVNPNDMPGVPAGTAVTNRTISFGAQPLFPSGIDGTAPGPFFQLFVKDLTNPCTQGSQTTNTKNQSGIVFFPGSSGLFRNGTLVGGFGVSGDGVDQDDFVTAGGAAGWEPPESVRADQIVINNVRLPYQKFPRNPTQ